jgi:sterol desaturase/sphingolipid hydroxylase (fatty acid hydroxylase superfamily)
VWLERRRPLRRAVESKLTRDARNLAVAVTSAIALRIIERPIVDPLAALVERRQWGLLKRLRLPAWLEVTAALVLMDYTLYVWHVLTHRAQWLWRFHVVHHVDLDLDASTALRFHFAELAISVPWRAAQVICIGVSPLSLSVWQTLLFLSIMFHHSNVRLPVELERRLNRFIVTPRMHGIHHSCVREETDSNWSSGLTLWDRLHGTLRLNVPQEAIMIGVPAYREPLEVELEKILEMPFGAQRAAWLLPGDLEPTRPVLSVAPDHLLA